MCERGGRCLWGACPRSVREDCWVILGDSYGAPASPKLAEREPQRASSPGNTAQRSSMHTHLVAVGPVHRALISAAAHVDALPVAWRHAACVSDVAVLHMRREPTA